MEKNERKSFRHPSNVSLFNLHDTLHFPSAQGKTILQLIEQKSQFFEWALPSSRIFCFDDFTYAYIQELGFSLSETAKQKQVEKRETFKSETVAFNQSYDGKVILDIGSERVKLYKPSYRLGFGNYADKTINELIELSPSRMEFFIQALPWFGLTPSAIDKLKSLEPNFIFLRSTFDLLNLKYSTAPDFMKVGHRKNKIDDEGNYHRSDNDNDPYMAGDPRHDRNENPWIDVFGEGDEAETAYWNTD